MVDEKFKEIARERDWYILGTDFLPDLDKISGVYLLVFENKKRYVGSTINFYSRLSTHLKEILIRTNDWHGAAGKENKLLYRPKFSEPFLLTDPRDELDKNGKKMGNRTSQTKLQEFLHYKQEYQKKKDEYYAAGHKYWELQKYIRILYCPCKDYGEFEDRLLQAIEEKEMWYNTLFRSGNIRRDK